MAGTDTLGCDRSDFVGEWCGPSNLWKKKKGNNHERWRKKAIDEDVNCHVMKFYPILKAEEGEDPDS